MQRMFFNTWVTSESQCYSFFFIYFFFNMLGHTWIIQGKKFASFLSERESQFWLKGLALEIKNYFVWRVAEKNSFGKIRTMPPNMINGRPLSLKLLSLPIPANELCCPSIHK